MVALLFALALLRAERGTAELQGRAGEPSRVLRLVPDVAGQGWTYALAGMEGWIPTRTVLYDSEGPLLSAATLTGWQEAVLTLGSRLLQQAEQTKEALP